MIIVTSVNIGQRETIQDGKRRYQTGINKKPVTEPVMVGEIGLQGDAVCDTRSHGGPDQAVYLYRSEDYEWWSSELGRKIGAGTFGENLTVAGLSSPALMVGDRLRFPDLVLEVTAPRIPCSTLATTMGDAKFAKTYMQASRPGIYFRVIRIGTVTRGDEIELIPNENKSISTVTFFHDFHRKLNREEIKRYLELPIDIRSRTDLEKRLKKHQ